jgi:hypothetical protein
MRRTIGRRSIFFAFLALVCFLLVPVTPPEFRLVAWGAGSLASLWAVLLGIEEVTRPRAERSQPMQAEVEMPFAPPRPPGR